MLSTVDKIQDGWKLATRWDVDKYQAKARSAISLKYALCKLEDGAITGSGYDFVVQEGSFPNFLHKLTTNLYFGK